MRSVVKRLHIFFRTPVVGCQPGKPSSPRSTPEWGLEWGLDGWKKGWGLKMDQDKINTFRQTIIDCGQRYSQIIESSFVDQIKVSKKLLPDVLTDKEQMLLSSDFFAAMLDYMFGTAVAITCNFSTNTEAAEQEIIDLVRDKFERMRTINKGGNSGTLKSV